MLKKFAEEYIKKICDENLNFDWLFIKKKNRFELTNRIQDLSVRVRVRTARQVITTRLCCLTVAIEFLLMLSPNAAPSQSRLHCAIFSDPNQPLLLGE